MKKFWMVVAVAVVVSGCGGGKMYKLSEDQNKIEKKGVIAVWANWVKAKGHKFDIEFNIQNQYKGPIVIMQRDLLCSRAGVPGHLQYTFFNSGARLVDFGEGQMKTIRMV